MKKAGKLSFLFIAVSPVGEGLSGGDRIFIELARNLTSRNMFVKIITWRDGLAMCKRNNLMQNEVLFEVLSLGIWENTIFLLNYIARIFRTVVWALSYDINKDFLKKSSIVIYSASEFWMDSLPGLILKLRFRNVIWVTTWFQTAPNPLKGYAEGKRESTYNSMALLYWLAQFPSKRIYARFADIILVNNEDERKRFPKLNKLKRIFVFIGAVDVEKIRKWTVKNKVLKKRYHGVFQGRFHPQKGVVELIEIWGKVVKIIPEAKLAMIGDGPLMNEVKDRIKQLDIAKNITLLGYVFDGDKKYTTFAKSRLVLHPAFYDSGGMASAEAMAFGMPCIGFKLKAYESYYPKGMVKVHVGDVDAFADAIVSLLNDKKMYGRFQKEAIELIENNWTWDDRVAELLKIIYANSSR